MSINRRVNERWRWVVGYEGLYMVSDQGRVKRIGAARGAKAGRILRPQRCTNGYLQVCLSKDRRQSFKRIHRLVATSFLEQKDGKNIVNHINGDRADNRACNLEWVTKSENALHSYRVLGNKKRRASPNARARKLDMETIKEIFLAQGTYREIGRRFGISEVMARNIKIGKCWSDVTCLLTV